MENSVPDHYTTTLPRICIAGAGAIGLTLAARLGLAGHAVTLVARGDSLRNIQRNGVRLIDLKGDHRVLINVVSAEDLRPCDVIFLCPKSHDLPQLAAAIRHAINRDTLLVPLVNGIPWWFFDTSDATPYAPNPADPSGVLDRLLPRDQLVGSVTMITAERLRPGVAKTTNPLKITLGELASSQTKRVHELAAILSAAGIQSSVDERIGNAVWTKVLLNLCSNPLSVISGATLSQLFSNHQLRDISHRMLNEAMCVARSCGADIGPSAAELLAIGSRMGEVKTSMLQDFERDAPLELSSICGAVIELARNHGLEMPTTRTVANLAEYLSINRRSTTARLSRERQRF